MRSTLIACCIALAACTADRALAQIAFATARGGDDRDRRDRGPGRRVSHRAGGAKGSWRPVVVARRNVADVHRPPGRRHRRLHDVQRRRACRSSDERGDAGCRIRLVAGRLAHRVQFRPWWQLVMSVDGGSVEQLTNDPGTDWCPTWSPDGERIVFTSQRTGRSSLHILELDGGDAQFVGGAPYACENPSWSPDGEWIAFRGALGTAYDICVVNVHGGMPRAVSTHTARDHEPAWSPDGSELAFASDRDGALAVYVMDAVDGSNVRRVTPEGIEAWSPAWARPPMPDEPRAVRAQDRRLVTRGAMRAQRPNQRHE